MSALALPICELMPMVGEAKARTKGVVVCSRAERADTRTAWRVARKTIGLKFELADLARRQEQLITKLVESQFSSAPVEVIRDVAVSVDALVASEKDLLRSTKELGTEIRVWWNASLLKLTNQIEHLDSISESLHLECDEQAPILMAAAIEQFSRA